MEKHGLHPPGILSVTHFMDSLMSGAVYSWGVAPSVVICPVLLRCPSKNMKVIFMSLCEHDCVPFSSLNYSAVPFEHPSVGNGVEVHTSQKCFMHGSLLSNDHTTAVYLLCLSVHSPRVRATYILIF